MSRRAARNQVRSRLASPRDDTRFKLAANRPTAYLTSDEESPLIDG